MSDNVQPSSTGQTPKPRAPDAAMSIRCERLVRYLGETHGCFF